MQSGRWTMSSPTDVFFSQVSPASDAARAAIQAVGLRPHRVFLVIDTWTVGTGRRREKPLISSAYTEILPTPKVVIASANMVVHSGGEILAGTVFLRKISRVNYTANELQGKDASGDDLSEELEFSIALKPLGSPEAEFYRPNTDIVLLSTAFEMTLRPQNQRRTLPIGTTSASITADP
jgi:hypothetical protein